MKTLNDYFKDYDESKRLHDSDYNKIRDKRNLIIQEIHDDETLTVGFDHLNLGSYKLRTGVKYEDGNYDIDCGLRFSIKEDELSTISAKKVKDSVFDIIRKYRDPSYKNKCITATYYKENEPLYHVDFPIFAYDKEKGHYYLADGKSDKVVWQRSYPEELINYLYSEDDNYKRIVRILKIWNYYAFKNEKKHCKAPSVALTLIAKQWFETNSYSDDLNALNQIALILKSKIVLNSIYLANPFTNENIFYKMAADSDCVSIFKDKVDVLISNLSNAISSSKISIYNTCSILKKVFPDFPQPEKEDTSESFGTNARYA